ncbi:hypothetical protein IAR55_000494 [Kwoniella newhampshirensis]|uniref:Uncharacterized protein n=1 Tax=Kwoniella newhampshirensis TaxID=1651941 RepID=A0AAW0Z7A3_9TREE
MPVTKKKGAIFAIYADSPDRSDPSHLLPSTSSSSCIRPPPPPQHRSMKGGSSSASSPSTTKRTQRKALSSLQPKPLSSASTTTTTTTINHNHPNIIQSKSTISEQEITKSKTKSKSVLTVYSDDVNLVKPSTATSTTTGVSRTSRTKENKPAPLAQSVSQTLSVKRNRDLLSPLPIEVAPRRISSHEESDTVVEGVASAVAGGSLRSTNGQSPAKRNRTVSSPVNVQRSIQLSTMSATYDNATTDVDPIDKENVPPPTMEQEGSPATRTRSKTRHSSISQITLSPLRFTSTPQGRRRRAEDLVGDGRGTLTLKKGRELARIMDAEIFGMVSISAEAGAAEKGKKRGGLRERAVRPDGALVDVSEAYGADGVEPEGFRTQRVSRVEVEWFHSGKSYIDKGRPVQR